MNLPVILSSFISGLLGAMGFGGGTALIIYLVSFSALGQKEAQGINLIFFLATGIFALVGNCRKGLVNKKELLPFLIFALPGLAVGYVLLPLIETSLLSKLFGAALLCLGVKELFSKNSRETYRH